MNPKERALEKPWSAKEVEVAASPDPRSLLVLAEISASLTKATACCWPQTSWLQTHPNTALHNCFVPVPLFRNWGKTNHSALLARRVSLHLPQPLETGVATRLVIRASLI